MKTKGFQYSIQGKSVSEIWKVNGKIGICLDCRNDYNTSRITPIPHLRFNQILITPITPTITPITKPISKSRARGRPTSTYLKGKSRTRNNILAKVKRTLLDIGGDKESANEIIRDLYYKTERKETILQQQQFESNVSNFFSYFANHLTEKKFTSTAAAMLTEGMSLKKAEDLTGINAQTIGNRRCAINDGWNAEIRDEQIVPWNAFGQDVDEELERWISARVHTTSGILF